MNAYTNSIKQEPDYTTMNHSQPNNNVFLTRLSSNKKFEQSNNEEVLSQNFEDSMLDQ